MDTEVSTTKKRPGDSLPIGSPLEVMCSSISYKTSDSHPSLPIGVSLGIEGVITIIGGCVGILTILGFLAFLWFEYGPSPEASRAPYAWSQIALHDWMTQAITLSALVLRFTTSLQAAVCTSMIASLLLEKRSVRRSQVPHFSILRVINDGRMKLLQLLVSSKTAIFRYVEFWLILLFIISGEATETPVPSLLTYNKSEFDFRLTSGFINRLPVYQIFAEVPATSWESVTCVVGGVGGRFWGIDLEPKWEPAEGPWSLNSTIHMVLSTNLRMIDWKTLPETGSLGSSEPYGEWLSFEPVDGHRLNITKFLGVDVPHRPHGERGILTMDIKGKPDDGPPGSPANDIVTIDGSRRTENHTIAELTIRVLEELLDYALSQSKNANSTLLLCYSCEALALPDHPVIAMLFSSIIAETGRAANALSSYMVVIGSTWYDAYRSSMLEMQNATTVTTKTVRSPGPCHLNSYGGFYSVVALVIAYLIHVVVITVLFVRQAQY
ncbi:hypothetical protein F4801DRAFT_592901 [Xylaria longipes]|nr:hypothetical protein F4801DRAFT_592901 [Xylaria longipes]